MITAKSATLKLDKYFKILPLLFLVYWFKDNLNQFGKLSSTNPNRKKEWHTGILLISKIFEGYQVAQMSQLEFSYIQRVYVYETRFCIRSTFATVFSFHSERSRGGHIQTKWSSIHWRMLLFLSLSVLSSKTFTFYPSAKYENESTPSKFDCIFFKIPDVNREVAMQQEMSKMKIYALLINLQRHGPWWSILMS